MNLQMDPSLGAGYSSASQVARRVTEDWAARNLYCAACLADSLRAERANTPVSDFHCGGCGASYQLKSKRGAFSGVVPNSEYEKKMAAVASGAAPHYAFLEYSEADWRVTGLSLVPGHFFTPAMIQQRPPLPDTARRAGWVGSNILLRALPPEARLTVVRDGVARDPADVRAEWDRFRFLRTDARARGGWGAAVLACVRATVQLTGASRFTLQEFYATHAAALSAQFPDNQNVEAKIRQQLQVLRDANVVAFRRPGMYEVVG